MSWTAVKYDAKEEGRRLLIYLYMKIPVCSLLISETPESCNYVEILCYKIMPRVRNDFREYGMILESME